jgi:hypothetical protein
MKWVYPWDDSGFKGPEHRKKFIYSKLRDLGYPVDKWEKPPKKKLLTVVDRRLDQLWEAVRLPTKLPWMLIVSNSAVVLQALADILPMVWALSTSFAVHNVDTATIVNLLKGPTPQDDWEDDPVGEQLHAIETAGMVVWERAEVTMSMSKFHEGEYLNLFRRSFDSKKDVLLMTAHAGVEKLTAKEVGKVEKKLAANVGESFIGIFKQYGIKRLLNVTEKRESWKSESM